MTAHSLQDAARAALRDVGDASAISPGEWGVSGPRMDIRSNKPITFIASIHQPDTHPLCATDKTAAANARLIAQAPALLRVVQALAAEAAQPTREELVEALRLLVSRRAPSGQIPKVAAEMRAAYSGALTNAISLLERCK